MTPSSLRPGLPRLAVAAALALAAAVSLGLARFSYALLLPAMRADLGWSYLTAGAMNTVNAAGYLAGALATPLVLRRFGARRVLLAGTAATAVALAAHGLIVVDAGFDPLLYALRFTTGVGSAATFVAGGLLAARIVGAPSGLVLGIYYGGTGLGIVASALLVPPLVERVAVHAWQAAWLGLGALAGVATFVIAAATRADDPSSAAPASGTGAVRFRWRAFAPGLLAYLLFGLGYIGYMTFVVTLLREQRLAGALITAFFAVLGLAVIGSSWLWAGLLQRFRGGESLALLSALLAVATLLPVVSVQPIAVFASGLLFGGVFLSVVASTTALVRHNLPATAWPAGIAAFTVVFAAGQIAGPSLIGLIADRFGGLRAGFACSAAVLATAALVASRQKPLG